MNVALTLSADNKAMLVYDEPIGFKPSWVETSADGQGLRIIGDDGDELKVGVFYQEINKKLASVSDVLLVRMERGQAVEGRVVPFISQNYD